MTKIGVSRTQAATHSNHQNALLLKEEDYGNIYYLLRNTTGVSLWMEVPAAKYASGQAKLGL